MYTYTHIYPHPRENCRDGGSQISSKQSQPLAHNTRSSKRARNGERTDREAIRDLRRTFNHRHWHRFAPGTKGAPAVRRCFFLMIFLHTKKKAEPVAWPTRPVHFYLRTESRDAA